MRAAIFLALLGLAGCQTVNTPAPTGATFCDVAKPIYWTPTDTRRTKEQVDSHNRVGKELCGWGTKK
jgi:hypothetical protein